MQLPVNKVEALGTVDNEEISLFINVADDKEFSTYHECKILQFTLQ